MKSEIGNKLQEIADIESKNQRIYQELSEAQETHKLNKIFNKFAKDLYQYRFFFISQVMDSLQREAEECREQLVSERELK